MEVLWDVMPCSLVDMYLRFGDTCCLQLHPRNLHAYSLTVVQRYLNVGTRHRDVRCGKHYDAACSNKSSAESLFVSAENLTCHFVYITHTPHLHIPTIFLTSNIRCSPNLIAMSIYSPHHVECSFVAKDMPVFTLQETEMSNSAMHCTI
jgi:hypothetical protein